MWRKSSYSNSQGACVETAAWRKSTRCDVHGGCIDVGTWRKASHSMSGVTGECVEAGTGTGVVGVRDTTQNGSGPVLEFSTRAWREFAAGLK